MGADDRSGRAPRLSDVVARQLEGWISSYLAIASGEEAVTSHTIEAITGVRPMTFAQFLRAEPQAWAHLAVTAAPPGG